MTSNIKIRYLLNIFYLFNFLWSTFAFDNKAELLNVFTTQLSTGIIKLQLSYNYSATLKSFQSQNQEQNLVNITPETTRLGLAFENVDMNSSYITMDKSALSPLTIESQSDFIVFSGFTESQSNILTIDMVLKDIYSSEGEQANLVYFSRQLNISMLLVNSNTNDMIAQCLDDSMTAGCVRTDYTKRLSPYVQNPLRKVEIYLNDDKYIRYLDLHANIYGQTEELNMTNLNKFQILMEANQIESIVLNANDVNLVYPIQAVSNYSDSGSHIFQFPNITAQGAYETQDINLRLDVEKYLLLDITQVVLMIKQSPNSFPFYQGYFTNKKDHICSRDIINVDNPVEFLQNQCQSKTVLSKIYSESGIPHQSEGINWVLTIALGFVIYFMILLLNCLIFRRYKTWFKAKSDLIYKKLRLDKLVQVFKSKCKCLCFRKKNKNLSDAPAQSSRPITGQEEDLEYNQKEDPQAQGPDLEDQNTESINFHVIHKNQQPKQSKVIKKEVHFQRQSQKRGSIMDIGSKLTSILMNQISQSGQRKSQKMSYQNMDASSQRNSMISKNLPDENLHNQSQIDQSEVNDHDQTMAHLNRHNPQNDSQLDLNSTTNMDQDYDNSQLRSFQQLNPTSSIQVSSFNDNLQQQSQFQLEKEVIVRQQKIPKNSAIQNQFQHHESLMISKPFLKKNQSVLHQPQQMDQISQQKQSLPATQIEILQTQLQNQMIAADILINQQKLSLKMQQPVKPSLNGNVEEIAEQIQYQLSKNISGDNSKFLSIKRSIAQLESVKLSLKKQLEDISEVFQNDQDDEAMLTPKAESVSSYQSSNPNVRQSVDSGNVSGIQGYSVDQQHQLNALENQKKSNSSALSS
eukprot:403369228